MKRNVKSHHISTFAALSMFVLLSVCILGSLLSGAGVYRRLAKRAESSYYDRTCSQYIVSKVRQCPSPDDLSVSSFGSGDCLTFTENIDGEKYINMIYCYGGYICELFSDAQYTPSPDEGEKIIEAESLKMHLENGLLSVSVTTGSGHTIPIYLSVRGGEGALQ